MKEPGLAREVLVLGAALLTCCLAACSKSSVTPVAPDAPSTPSTQGSTRSYTTQFARAENPIAEQGMWINGRAAGPRADAAVPGLAFGTESGNGGDDDSTALLTGTWGPNQMAQATVHTVNQNDNVFEEVELRLRSTLAAHRAAGYEINFRCSKTSSAYTQIVRWNGPLGQFTLLDAAGGAQYGVADGDVVKATIVGSLIPAYINGVQVLQATDVTYAAAVGIRFYLRGVAG